MRRIGQLAVITVAAGAIYPLLYLRQNFEVSMLETFGVTASQLGQCNALLGVLFVVTYLPSGWLADRVSPRYLMSLSLLCAGLLGVWFSSTPSFAQLQLIYAGWGIATGLTFWSAHIKAVAVLARGDEQGRFFGILDGGRGLVEALLATVAVASFAYWLEGLGEPTDAALRKVIWLYVGNMLALAPVVLFVVDNSRADDAGRHTASLAETARDLRVVLARPQIWLAAVCIMTGYQLFFATYAFSAYLQQNFGLTAVTVGTITVAKLWMRPFGAIGAGFLGDILNRERVLDRVKGLAIGVISLIGYAPDIYLPLIRGALVDRAGPVRLRPLLSRCGRVRPRRSRGGPASRRHGHRVSTTQGRDADGTVGLFTVLQVLFRAFWLGWSVGRCLRPCSSCSGPARWRASPCSPSTPPRRCCCRSC